MLRVGLHTLRTIETSDENRVMGKRPFDIVGVRGKPEKAHCRKQKNNVAGKLIPMSPKASGTLKTDVV